MPLSIYKCRRCHTVAPLCDDVVVVVVIVLPRARALSRDARTKTPKVAPWRWLLMWLLQTPCLADGGSRAGSGELRLVGEGAMGGAEVRRVTQGSGFGKMAGRRAPQSPPDFFCKAQNPTRPLPSASCVLNLSAPPPPGLRPQAAP